VYDYSIKGQREKKKEEKKEKERKGVSISLISKFFYAGSSRIRGVIHN